MPERSVLVVEDNALVGVTVRDFLRAEGFEPVLAHDGATAEAALAAQAFAAAILDLCLPDGDGRDFLQKWRQQYPQMPVVIMTAYGDIQKAVDCIRAGAYDFLTKPVERVLLKKTVANALEQVALTRQVQNLSQLQQRQEVVHFEGVVAESPALAQTLEFARRVAESDFSSLFIRGESGTGKGLLARTVHRIGRRGTKPFVEVNCSALPATLVESELFGHRKGAFTDAKEDKVGLFELADGGTLFLDEIGDMEKGLQAKLLKVIEEKHFRRVGDVRDLQADVAIIAATNHDVEALVASGEFREDLYYRLNVVPLVLPPLRDRPEDVPALCRYFLDHFGKRFGRPVQGFTPLAMQRLQAYNWPGNVRELRNVVERGCLLTREPTIDVDLLLFPAAAKPLTTAGPQPATADAMADQEGLPLAEIEKRAILRTMDRTAGNRHRAAAILGIHRTTLYKKLDEYGYVGPISGSVE